MNVNININDESVVRDMISEDALSATKRAMREGERYYDGEHDILKHDFQSSYVYESGTARLITNPNNSNHHNIHNYYAELVDQKAAYIVGKPLTVSVEGAEKDTELKAFEDEITKYTSDEKFSDIINDLIIGASNKGREYILVYYDIAAKLKYCILPAENVIPIYNTRYQDTLESVIYYYPIYHQTGRDIKKKNKVEWWTTSGVKYFSESDDGTYMLDDTAAHWLSKTYIDGKQTKAQPYNWGRLPIIELKNNTRSTNDLQPIKSLQDAVNLLSSATTNSEIDLVALYWTLSGYDGEDVQSIVQKLQINKAVAVDSTDGSVSSHQITLPVKDRLDWLAMLRRDIYRDGRGFDNDLEFVGNATNVALQLQYSRLDQKANLMITKLKSALKELMWLITDHINRAMGTDYDSSLIRIDVNKSCTTNDSEFIANLISLKQNQVIPDALATSLCPYVDDVNQALEDLDAQKNETEERMSRLYLNDDVKRGDDDDES